MARGAPLLLSRKKARLVGILGCIMSSEARLVGNAASLMWWVSWWYSPCDMKFSIKEWWYEYQTGGVAGEVNQLVALGFPSSKNSGASFWPENELVFLECCTCVNTIIEGNRKKLCAFNDLLCVRILEVAVCASQRSAHIIGLRKNLRHKLASRSNLRINILTHCRLWLEVELWRLLVSIISGVGSRHG